MSRLSHVTIVPIDKALMGAFLAYAALKGSLLALLYYTVFNSQLVDALIVAAVSGTLGIVGMVWAAWLTNREIAKHVKPQLGDIAAKIEADKRVGDKEDE